MSTTADFVDIVFDGPPGPESGRFVEVENASGASIRFGEWVHREDGYWVLRIAHPAPPAAGEAVIGKDAALDALDEVLYRVIPDGVYGDSAWLDRSEERESIRKAIRSLPPIAATATVPLRTRDELIATFIAEYNRNSYVPMWERIADAILQRGIVHETVPLKGEREIAEAVGALSTSTTYRRPHDATTLDAVLTHNELRSIARAVLSRGIAWDPEKAARKFRELHYYPQPGDGPLTDADRADALEILKAGSGA